MRNSGDHRIGPLLSLLLCVMMARMCHGELSDNVDCIQFPRDFIFGCATSAYQIEGYPHADGKGESIWDIFSHIPGNIHDNQNGDVAAEHYERYEEDALLISNLGVKYYRMSISWTRIMPNGTFPINQAGVDHYIKEFKVLKKLGIVPFVTLYHWDLPQALQELYGGWLYDGIDDIFTDYADTCFRLFSEYVNFWSTFNEPYVVSWLGNGVGEHAPGRCSDRSNCEEGNTSTEPYRIAHNLLRSHAKAVQIFRENYEVGKIGIVLNSDWALSLTDKEEDILSQQRYIDFLLGWFADPVTEGKYPDTMVEYVGDRLPTFTVEEKERLKDSIDFIGINHYTSVYVSNGPPPNSSTSDGWEFDKHCTTTRLRDGIPIGPQAQSEWLYVYPEGIRSLLKYVSNTYKLDIYVTENGVDAPNETTIDDAINDEFRLNYIRDYIKQVSNAIYEDKVTDIKGYFVWSLLDNFEWAEGYSSRFGIHFVDFETQNRTMKASAEYFMNSVVKCNREPNYLWTILAFASAALLLLITVIVLFMYFISTAEKYEKI